MKSMLLSIGTELLFGSIVNTNSVYLSEKLNEIGVDVLYHATVGDNPARLKKMILQGFEDCDLIITTGGLGPTQDDITKEVAAEAMGAELVLHEPSLSAIKERFAKNLRPMTENNLRQAYMPEGADVLPNPNGTAPGFFLEKSGKIIVSMPGPPTEMKPMFENFVLPRLSERTDGHLYYRTIRTFEVGESTLETLLMDLIEGQTDPTLATYAKANECSLRIASKKPDIREAEKAVDEMLGKVLDRVGKFVYSVEDRELSEVVFNILLEKKISISAAESCTGGLFSKSVTDYPGSSNIFERGIVTYSDRAKVEELGVRAETLEKFGAVSGETAREMAEGLAKVAGSDLCISVTGIAGPDGGSEGKPVGLTYIAVRYKGKTSVEEFIFRKRAREARREAAVFQMFRLIYKTIADRKF